MPDLNPTTLALADLPEQLSLPRWSRQPGQAPIDITLRPPGSKSITNRALLLAALAPGTSTLHHPLTQADDAQRMLAAITQLGASIDDSDPDALKITGVNGKWTINPNDSTLDLNNAGTATRFLTASALLADAPLTITGNARMQQRPIAELAEVLKHLGCSVTYEKFDGCPPITISPNSFSKDRSSAISVNPELIPSVVNFTRTQSSQFISALMLTAVFLPEGMTFHFPDGITSQSYVQMTLDLLDHLGVQIRSAQDLSVIQVLPGLNGFTLDIEPDASGATYWWAAGALLPSATVRVEGFSNSTTSLQGDAHFPTLLEQMGCTLIARDNTLAVKGTNDLRPIMCDMRDMPDAVMSLAAVACFAPGTTIVKGVKTLRVKECDRIDAMKTELAKLGVTITDNLNGDEDALSITPPQNGKQPGIDCSDNAPPVSFDTYDDHRMAMSLALLALRRPNITINDPKCVAKTYPNYFQHFAKLYR